MESCREQVQTGDMEFDDVTFTRECTVQLESHRRINFYKKGQPVKYKVENQAPPKGECVTQVMQ